MTFKDKTLETAQTGNNMVTKIHVRESVSNFNNVKRCNYLFNISYKDFHLIIVFTKILGCTSYS